MRKTLLEMVVLQNRLEKMATIMPVQKIRNEIELAAGHVEEAGQALAEAIKRNEEHHHV